MTSLDILLIQLPEISKPWNLQTSTLGPPEMSLKCNFAYV